MGKRIAIIVVTIAASLFILSWGIENYQAFRWTKSATEKTIAAMQSDTGKTNYQFCDIRSGGNQQLSAACNAATAEGLSSFKQKWRTAETGRKIRLVQCFDFATTGQGTDWLNADMCAGQI